MLNLTHIVIPVTQFCPVTVSDHNYVCYPSLYYDTSTTLQSHFSPVIISDVNKD